MPAMLEGKFVVRNRAPVPEPTKEGEGKEDEQKAAEALRLDASGDFPTGRYLDGEFAMNNVHNHG